VALGGGVVLKELKQEMNQRRQQERRQHSKTGDHKILHSKTEETKTKHARLCQVDVGNSANLHSVDRDNTSTMARAD
jgi:hypothetical protein